MLCSASHYLLNDFAGLHIQLVCCCRGMAGCQKDQESWQKTQAALCSHDRLATGCN